MDLKSGLPWWLIKNGLEKEYNILESNLETEVLIVGSGITGALVAHFLCEAGAKCVMVDKRMTSTGSTTASTAQLQYEIDTSLIDLCDLVGTKNAVRSYQLCLESIKTLQKIVKKLKIDCDFEMKSSLYLASTKKDSPKLRKEYLLRKEHGLPVKLIESQELKSRFGIEKDCALYNTESAEVDAYRLCRKLLQHHIEHSGLEVYSYTEITKTEHLKLGLVLQTANGLKIKTRKMICSPGFESEFFLKEKYMKLNSTYVFISRPIPGKLWKDQCLIWETSRPYLYLRTTPDNRIIAGGEDEPFKNAESRDSVMEIKNEKILKKVKALFPDLKPEIDFYWCGVFGETKDGLPYIGEHPEHPNTYFALGYGGNGITFSVIAAEIIRDLSLGKQNRDAEIFNFRR